MQSSPANSPAKTGNAISNENSDNLLLNCYLSSRTPESFTELVRRHTGLVFGTCLRITRNRQDAEELTQECFFDLARHASQIRSSLAGWLHRAATNRALNRKRNERLRKDRELAAGEQRHDLACEPQATDVTWNDIEPIFDELLLEIPEDLRTPILMHFIEGASQVDIATHLGVHQSTISRRLSDGLKMLRLKLRTAGIVVSSTLILSFFASQTAIAEQAPRTLALGKISLVGIGATKASGWSQFAWLFGVIKGLTAVLFLPIVAGVVWGEIMFVLALTSIGSYIAFRQPEWFRVLCFTRQSPNVYEWPFFPLQRFTWGTPPPEWRLWMSGTLMVGMELLCLAVVLPTICQAQSGSLLSIVAGLFCVSVGIRIWNRVRICKKNFSASLTLRESPIEGSLLLTLALGWVVQALKLCLVPFLLLTFPLSNQLFAQVVFSSIVWGTVLVFGLLLTYGRFKEWRNQPTCDWGIAQIERFAPPRKILILFLLIPLAMAVRLAYFAMIQDVLPIDIPYGASAVGVARFQIFGNTMIALDCVVLALLPITYLRRRIPRIVWGAGFGVLVLVSLFHVGSLARTVIAVPAYGPQNFAHAPLLEIPPNYFALLVTRLPKESQSGPEPDSYMAGVSIAYLRLQQPSMVQLKYEDKTLELAIPQNANDRSPITESIAMVQLRPMEFKSGFPTVLNISLNISDPLHKQDMGDFVSIPLPENHSVEEWRSLFELVDFEEEQSYKLGTVLTLGMVQGKPVTLTVIP